MDYATAAGEIITEVQVVCIAYGLVTEMGKSKEDCRTWHAKPDTDKYLD